MITAFLPCRKGSQRIPDKNVKPFAGIEGGLLRVKLDQLLSCKLLDAIVVSSNDERVLEFAKTRQADGRVIIDERPEYLGSSTTTTDELIKYVPSIIKEGEILWTHVTSPFINEEDYNTIIEFYKKNMGNEYDSLMTAHEIRSFIWDRNKPINYDRKHTKWPFTQNIEPLYDIDSGVFISSVESYILNSDRIGTRPYLYSQDKIKSLDIDWPEDFLNAERVWKQLNKSIGKYG